MIALHGPPKVGKSQLASRFPSPVQWLATEYGHRYIPLDQRKSLVQLKPGNGWDTLRQWIASNPSGFKTLVIDTVSGFYDLAQRFVCKKNKWEHPTDGAHGRGWDAVKTELFRRVSEIVDIAASNRATLIIIDHSKEDTIETATSTNIKVNFAMPGTARRIILPVPDHMWFLGYDEQSPNDALKSYTSKRALFTEGTANIEAGCRDPEARPVVIRPLSKLNPYKQILEALYGNQKEKKE
jgi:hypothetical protein